MQPPVEIESGWPSGKPQICFFCFSKQNKREKAEKAGKLRDNQAGSTAIKREKHEKQRAVFLMWQSEGTSNVNARSGANQTLVSSLDFDKPPTSFFLMSKGSW